MRLRIATSLLLLTPALHAAILVVDTTSDSAGLSACTATAADCSLRGAILSANATAAADTITFNIPMSDPGCTPGTGVCRIVVASNFPGINQPLIIDGYTQPGAQANTIPAPGANNAQLKIELTHAPGFAANGLFTGGSGSVPFELSGLAIFMPGNSLVGFSTGQSPRFRIRGNWFGVTAAGAVPDYSAGGGVFSISGANRRAEIGGPEPADRNVIAGSGRDLSSPPLPGGGSNFLQVRGGVGERGVLLVQGNLIGLAPDGITPLPFRDPLVISVDSLVGGTPDIQILDNRIARARRVFGGGFGGAVDFRSSTEMEEPAIFQGNVFGLGVDGSVIGVEKDHIDVFLTNSARVARLLIGGLGIGQGNVFAGGIRQSASDLGSAVRLPNGAVSTFVEFVGNHMLGNDGVGLDFPTATGGGAIAYGRTLNDADDADVGANNQQNHPQILAYGVGADSFTVRYRVDSTPANSAYPLRVDFYRARGDEGEELLDSDIYMPAQAQTEKLVSLPIPPGVTLSADDVLVAIATDAEGRSSEFSFGTLASVAVATGPGPFFDVFGLTVQVTANAATGPFRPNGKVLVSINTSPAVTCTATLQPAAALLTSIGSCHLPAFLHPGNRSLTATYLTLQGAFASPTGGNVVGTAPVTILAERIFRHDFELP